MFLTIISGLKVAKFEIPWCVNSDSGTIQRTTENPSEQVWQVGGELVSLGLNRCVNFCIRDFFLIIIKNLT